jgi:hypothetical protein
MDMINICDECGKQFKPYRPKNRFCCKKCRTKNENKRYKKHQKKWLKENWDRRKECWRKYNKKNKEKIRRKNKENYYKRRDIYLAYQKDPLRRVENNLRGKAKRIMIKSGKEKICSDCGDDKNIQVHHVDFNVRNNETNNLVYLCLNCHRFRHRA